MPGRPIYDSRRAAPISSRAARLARRRRNRAALIVTATALLVTGLGTLFTFLSVRSLYMQQDTRRVVGKVLHEKRGTIRNELTVTYEIDGVTFRRTIPVTRSVLSHGNGHGDLPTASVDLLVSKDEPGSVRTVAGWAPAFYVWKAAFTVACLMGLPFLAVLWYRRAQAIRQSDLAFGRRVTRSVDLDAA